MSEYPAGHPLASARMLPTNIGDPEPERTGWSDNGASDEGAVTERYGLNGHGSKPGDDESRRRSKSRSQFVSSGRSRSRPNVRLQTRRRSRSAMQPQPLQPRILPLSRPTTRRLARPSNAASRRSLRACASALNCASSTRTCGAPSRTSRSRAHRRRRRCASCRSRSMRTTSST